MFYSQKTNSEKETLKKKDTILCDVIASLCGSKGEWQSQFIYNQNFEKNHNVTELKKRGCFGRKLVPQLVPHTTEFSQSVKYKVTFSIKIIVSKVKFSFLAIHKIFKTLANILKLSLKQLI